MCWKSILTHSSIHPKVLKGLPTHSNPFCLSLISHVCSSDSNITAVPLGIGCFPEAHWHTMSRQKQRQSPATVTFTWNLICALPEMKSLNGDQARERLLTCPSALVPPLGTDGVLFLKGTPTFHPFVSGCKEKIKEDVRMGNRRRGEIKEAREIPF